ncbi:aquaporin-like protein [Mycena leptocephala]|nr:aquaporin-like protein [Mycena leptocephala]
MSTARLRKPNAPTSQSAFRRYRLREPFAEFLGVAILIIFGAGVNCQVLLSSASGDYLAVSFGWAVGLSLGVWVSSGISPAHINPAVTLAMATWRGFPWKKVPVRRLHFCTDTWGIHRAAIVYANYFHAIDIFEAPPRPGPLPALIFLVILGISSSLGMQTGTFLVSWFLSQPRADFGPRLLSAAVGYPGVSATDTSTGSGPHPGPVVGAQLAIALYDTFLYEEETVSSINCK